MRSTRQVALCLAVCLAPASWALACGASERAVASQEAKRPAALPPAASGGSGGNEGLPASLSEHKQHLDVGADAKVEADLEPAPELGPEAPAATPPRPQGLRGVSFVLLLGFDNRSDRVTGRTDTMIIGAFRARDHKVAAFSIPRDLWIEIPELGPARISSVYRIGEVKLGRGQGLPLLRRVLEAEFGVRIDHYAGVDLAAFVDLVDAVGGVEVEVQCPIRDCFWPSKTAEACVPLNLDAGAQELDGAQALMFARSRHGRGDRDRTRRQQAVLVAFGRKVVERGAMHLPALWGLAQPHLRSDLSPEAAAYYAGFALETPLDEIGGFAITKPLVERHITEDRKHVLLLSRAHFDAALAKAFDSRLPALKAKRRCPAADIALHAPQPSKARRPLRARPPGSTEQP